MKVSHVVVSALAALVVAWAIMPSSAETAHAIPPPTADEVSSAAATKTAVFAGGCFWGVQGVYQHVEGVVSAVSGYAGGEQATAQYEKSAAAGRDTPSRCASSTIRAR